MEPSKQRDYELTWTPVEKKTARKAFDKAFERHCAAITAEVRRMLESATAPADISRVQEYLSENRNTVDRIYCLQVFGFDPDLLHTHAEWMVDGSGPGRPTGREDCQNQTRRETLTDRCLKTISVQIPLNRFSSSGLSPGSQMTRSPAPFHRTYGTRYILVGELATRLRWPMKLLRPFLPLVFVVVLCGLFVSGSSPLRGQSAQSAVPQWQIDAGGKNGVRGCLC